MTLIWLDSLLVNVAFVPVDGLSPITIATPPKEVSCCVSRPFSNALLWISSKALKGITIADYIWNIRLKSLEDINALPLDVNCSPKILFAASVLTTTYLPVG